MDRYTLNDIYRFYKAEGGTLHKSVFKNLCQDFNIRVMNQIIYDAKEFDMGNNLSTLSILRIKRNPLAKPAIDWKASNDYREELELKGEKLYDPKTGEGTKWLIYFHDQEWYCRFYWRVNYAKVKNKRTYKFIATRGDKGNKTKLIKHLRENDINYVKYEVAKSN